MKCACGNEQGKPRVKPYPVMFIDVKTKKEMELLYNAGMRPFGDGHQCWFCTFSR